MIGIYDSGSGGLTVLKELRKQAPQCDFVYFGDTKHAPYGNRTPAELGALTAIGIQRLIRSGASEIITACNTVSVHIVDPMYQILELEKRSVIEMIKPTVTYLKKNQRILGKTLLVCTKATHESGVYKAEAQRQEVELTVSPIVELVAKIEGGASHAEIGQYISLELEKLDITRYDSLVLGCTHFPLVEDIFTASAESQNLRLRIINPAESVIEEVIKRFDTAGNRKTVFMLSKDSAVFRDFVSGIGINNATFTIL